MSLSDVGLIVYIKGSATASVACRRPLSFSRNVDSKAMRGRLAFFTGFWLHTASISYTRPRTCFSCENKALAVPSKNYI